MILLHSRYNRKFYIRDRRRETDLHRTRAVSLFNAYVIRHAMNRRI